MLSGTNPSSPTHYFNLPRTCGQCHVNQLQAFERSNHFELLEAGDQDAPSCSTCHSNAGSFLLSSRGLERTCNRCHGEQKRAPRPGRTELARDLHDRIVAVRDQLESAEKMIRRVKNEERQSELQYLLQQAGVPLKEAIASAHDFTFEAFEERMTVAGERAAALVERLANPN